MSCWTHIVATIDVDTYTEDDNIKTIAEDILKDAPQITGSEGNADIFVNVKSGHNSWTSADCKRCEYKDTVIHHEEGGFSCDAEDDYCPVGEYQTRVVITVIGDLRDRQKEHTRDEYKAFYKFVKSKFNVRNKTVKIIG